MPDMVDLNLPPPRLVACFKVEEIPHVEFHWLVRTNQLFVVIPQQGNRALLLFDRIADQEQAKQCVAAWCAGYRFKAEELGAPAIGSMPTILVP